MQRYIITATVTILIFLALSLYYYKNKAEVLEKDNKLKDEAISSIIDGYNQALEVKEIETISQVKKAEIEANTRLKKAIQKRGEIEIIQNNNNDFIPFAF